MNYDGSACTMQQEIFTVKYKRADGRLIDNRVSGVHHISGQEYWQIEMASPGSGAAIELSFNDANQSGITDLSSLRVARLNDDGWNDAGSQATSGSAGGRGSVTSTFQVFPGAGTNTLFALAGSNGSQNPLPLHSVLFNVEEKLTEAIIHFDTTGLIKVELQQRIAGDTFITMETKSSADWSIAGYRNYFKVGKSSSTLIYRLSFYLKNGMVINSREFLIHPNTVAPFEFNVLTQNGELSLRLRLCKKYECPDECLQFQWIAC